MYKCVNLWHPFRLPISILQAWANQIHRARRGRARRYGVVALLVSCIAVVTTTPRDVCAEKPLLHNHEVLRGVTQIVPALVVANSIEENGVRPDQLSAMLRERLRRAGVEVFDPEEYLHDKPTLFVPPRPTPS